MKRIVICADGTWNQRDQVDEKTGKRRPTNVTKIARAVLSEAPDGVSQVVYYHSGVGTGGPLDSVTGGAFGHGMEDNIRALYRFILYNHVEGDELYLFGFSRGAFTVRSLAGFMHRHGLVRKRDDYWVPEMYRCYESGIEPGSAEWTKVFTGSTGKPRVEQVRPCPPITFLGVWDTVGALGAPGLLGQLFNSQRHRYHAVDLNDSIRTAVHAVAIDEHRKPFDATLFHKPPGWGGTLHQSWFAGVHSNVGGSYDPDGLANVALHWMGRHAQRAGLVLDWKFLSFFAPVATSTLHDSMKPMYRLMGPIDRRIGGRPECNETVHESVLERMQRAELGYKPRNLPPDLPVAGMPELPPR